MKRSLLQLAIVFTLIGIIAKNSYAQITVSSANSTATNGVASSPLISGATSTVLFGFTLSNNTGAAVTINQFVLGASQSYVGNAYLYRSTAGNVAFGSASSIQSLGSLGTYISINVTESIPANSSYTYFIVGDLNSIPGYVTLPSTIQFSFSSAIRSSPYKTFGSGFNGTNYTINNPTYTVTSANTTGNGISSSPATITQTGLVLFGFGVSANATTTVTGFNISSSSTQNYLSYYLGNGKLYRSTSSTFSVGSSTLVASGANVSFSNYQHTPGVAISNLTETITGTTVYYFLVADFNQTSGTLPATIQFSFQTSLSNSIVQSSPNSANVAVSSTISGSSFTLQNPTYTFTSANSSSNGITQGTLYPGQTGIVLYGFGVSATASTTVSGFNLYNTYNQNQAQAYFTNGKLYRSTSSTFSVGTATQVSGASIGFGYDANSGISISGLSESITGTTVYYFVVADFSTGYYGALPATSQFSFKTSQSNAAVVQTSPSSSNIAVSSNVDGTNFSLARSTATVTGINSTTDNGITTGVLSYGQNNIVLFGFSVQVSGSLTFSQFNIKTTGNESSYFSNVRMYRSTTSTFPVGTSPTYTSSQVSANGGGYFVANVTEAITNTTYYYWIVADYTVAYGTNPATFACSFASGQGSSALITSSPNYATYNTYNVSGNTFTITNTEYWTGAFSTDLNDYRNYTPINGGTGFTPTSATTLLIGNAGYTNSPNLNTNLTIGALRIADNATVNLTSTNNRDLIVSSGLFVGNGATFTYDGGGGVGGTMTLSSGSVSSIASTGTLLVSGKGTLINSGTFTLQSDASGSAVIGQIPTSASITGTFNVQRYIAGGSLARRNYRLMSAPVVQTTAGGQPAYGFTDLQATTPVTGYGATGTYSATQPTSAFDNSGTGNPSIFFYYEPDPDPSSSVISKSDYKGLNSISEKFLVGNGFLMFFRGNRSTTDASGNSKVSTTAVPENTTLNFTGTLNQGTINVYIPKSPIITSGSNKVYQTPTSSSQISASFSYTANTGSNNGLHLVGNPYPCTIDLDLITLTNPGSTSIYTLNATGTMSAYVKGSGGTTGRYILPGQGFFVVASSAGNTALTFTESAKVISGITNPTTFAYGNTDPLLLAASALGQNLSAIQTNALKSRSELKVALQLDSNNVNETSMIFDADGANKYNPFEDAYYRYGLTQTVFMASYTTDSQPCLINHMGAIDSVKTVKLYAEGQTTGIYKLQFSGASTIDPRYRPVLIDSFKGDSLDLSANSVYSFNIDRANAKTYGANRFTIVFRPTDIAKRYTLVSFAGTKSASGALLAWKTQYEGNYTGFTLQRSTDGWKTYTALTSLQSNGTGSYSFTDANPDKGVNEYRLVQNNINNTDLLSDIVTVSYLTANPQTKKLQVYPNPVKTDINVDLDIPANATMVVKIYNITGLLVKTEKFAPGSAATLNLSALISGLYTIDVSDTDNNHYGATTFVKL